VSTEKAHTERTHKEKLRGLYAITDENLITEENFKQSVELALQGGAKIIQYRDKSKDQKKRFQQASLLQSLCTDYQAACIINDDIELAKSINAEGIHLGKEDVSISHARQILGDDIIIGISCYNDLDIAIEAEKNDADYVAFGAMFSSPTKPDANQASPELIAIAKKQLSIPICAIGGITEKNIQLVIQQGADMAAVISCLFSSSDIKNTASTLSQNFA
jgi:thiamine-phosphate pyrophosphorylase